MFAKREGAVDAARQEVGRLFGLEREFEQKRRERLSAADAEEASAVDAMLVGGALDLGDRFGKADVEARACAKAVEALRRQRVAAVEKLYRVEAAELRKAAAAKRAEGESLAARTRPLLRKLAEIEGVEYDSSILLAQRAGTWIPGPTSAGDLSLCNPFEAGPDPGGQHGPGHWAVPQSIVLQREAIEMERRAADLETRALRADGSLVKSSFADLLAAEELQDQGRLCPAVHAIEAWAQNCEAQIEQRGLSAAPRRYSLNWIQGGIDLENSSIEVDIPGRTHGAPSFRFEK